MSRKSFQFALLLGLLFAGAAAQAGMFGTEEALQSADERCAERHLRLRLAGLGSTIQSGNLAHVGSAVLIDPNYILLTGHGWAYSYTSLQFGLGSNVYTNPGQTRGSPKPFSILVILVEEPGAAA